MREGGRKFRLLDLFCCAGGAGVGYSRAGFEIVGVDISPQPNYPFEFIQADALTLNSKFIASFDVIHASPLHVNPTPTLPSETAIATRGRGSSVRCVIC